MKKSFALLWLALAAPAWAGDLNSLVLKASAEMPAGGSYATNTAAAQGLIDAVRIDPGFEIDASEAKPSFCTTATYLVFLKALQKARESGQLSAPMAALRKLSPP